LSLSGPSRNYGDAPRAPRRPPRKARGGTIPGVFDRRATPRGGMHRRPNAAVITRRATKTRHRAHPKLAEQKRQPRYHCRRSKIGPLNAEVAELADAPA